jgi:hypothetical protein
LIAYGLSGIYILRELCMRYDNCFNRVVKEDEITFLCAHGDTVFTMGILIYGFGLFYMFARSAYMPCVACGVMFNYKTFPKRIYGKSCGEFEWRILDYSRYQETTWCEKHELRVSHQCPYCNASNELDPIAIEYGWKPTDIKMPLVQCPICHGCGGACLFCRGHGLVSGDEIKELRGL